MKNNYHVKITNVKNDKVYVDMNVNAIIGAFIGKKGITKGIAYAENATILEMAEMIKTFDDMKEEIYKEYPTLPMFIALLQGEKEVTKEKDKK
jgi:hypothetical protein